jgi:hypothetical protein
MTTPYQLPVEIDSRGDIGLEFPSNGGIQAYRNTFPAELPGGTHYASSSSNNAQVVSIAGPSNQVQQEASEPGKDSGVSIDRTRERAEEADVDPSPDLSSNEQATAQPDLSTVSTRTQTTRVDSTPLSTARVTPDLSTVSTRTQTTRVDSSLLGTTRVTSVDRTSDRTENADIDDPSQDLCSNGHTTAQPGLSIVSTPTQSTRVDSSLQSPSRVGTSIPVAVPLSKLERVRTLRLVSSKTIIAREVFTSRRDRERLRLFVSYVRTKNQRTLFNRELPQCVGYLVEIDEGSGPPQTYICIDGLVEEADIKDFYSVMSQRSCRKFYEPYGWKLCFNSVSVDMTAAETYQTSAHPDDLTMCGALLRTERDGQSWISSIGGLVMVNNLFYAITTAHRPTPARTRSSSTFPSSPATTLRDEDFPDHVESALVMTIDGEKLGGPAAGVNQQPEPDPQTSWWNITSRSITEQGDDWRLVPVSVDYELPNSITLPGTKGMGDLIPPTSDEPRILYVSECVDEPGGSPVLIKAGVSGLCSGTVSLAPSYLDGQDGPLEVWAVHINGPGMIRSVVCLVMFTNTLYRSSTGRFRLLGV